MDIDPMMVKTAADGIRSALDMFKTAVGLAKDAKELLPNDTSKKAVEQSLDRAEMAAKLAEAQIAQALGYHLCQCTFPPQIMLSVGRHSSGTEVFKCSHCSKQEPTERTLRAHERIDHGNSGGGAGSWMGA